MVFSGDVLFAGSIGRTDLPGGDPVGDAGHAARRGAAPAATPRRCCPGHGPQTVMARERATNPYLQADYLGGAWLLMSRPRPLSGFPEFLPAGRIVEQRVLDSPARDFELHGFGSIETRAVETDGRS